MARWSGPAGWARVAAHHRRRQADAIATGDDTLAAEADRAATTYEAMLDVRCRCRRCGRVLSDPASVRRRIGPECVKRETG
jgi:hypothetical protein